MADITKEQVVEFIEKMSVLELAEMVKELEDKFGVSAAAPVAGVAPPNPRNLLAPLKASVTGLPAPVKNPPPNILARPPMPLEADTLPSPVPVPEQFPFFRIPSK